MSTGGGGGGGGWWSLITPPTFGQLAGLLLALQVLKQLIDSFNRTSLVFKQGNELNQKFAMDYQKIIHEKMLKSAHEVPNDPDKALEHLKKVLAMSEAEQKDFAERIKLEKDKGNHLDGAGKGLVATGASLLGFKIA